jgi:hypothetical protein
LVVEDNFHPWNVIQVVQLGRVDKDLDVITDESWLKDAIDGSLARDTGDTATDTTLPIARVTLEEADVEDITDLVLLGGESDHAALDATFDEVHRDEALVLIRFDVAPGRTNIRICMLNLGVSDGIANIIVIGVRPFVAMLPVATHAASLLIQTDP